MSEELNIINTRPEFTKDDFRVSGSEPDTFRYPFESTYELNKGKEYPGLIEHYDSPLGLEARPLPNGSTYFQAPGTDITETIGDMSDTVVEVGGPTEGGYISVGSVDLRSQPIITNLGSAFVHPNGETQSYNRLTSLDKLTIDALADVRKLPFRSQSVGLVLNAHMNKTALDETASGYYSNQIGVENARELVLHTYVSTIQKIIEHGEKASLAEEVKISPRIGLWIEANRVLKDGGVFVMRGADRADVNLAAVLGFAVIGHGPMYKRPGVEVDYNDLPNEIVFQKNKL